MKFDKKHFLKLKVFIEFYQNKVAISTS
jgi:hypothetical protein